MRAVRRKWISHKRRINVAGTYNITIEQGATFYMPVTIKDSTLTPFDLTGWLARGQIRKRRRSSTIVASFSFTITTPANGEIIINMPAATTALISAGETEADERSKYVWDFEIYRPLSPTTEEVKRILEGAVFVSPEVTR
jgi:hypothetical protein